MEKTKIEWADATFNPWIGCTKVSPACKHCYAERDMDHRYGKVAWGPSGTRVKTTEANWRKPLAWNKKAEAAGTRIRVFCSSLADVFEDWNGPILNHKGERLYKSWTKGGEWQIESDVQSEKRPPVTMNDLRRNLFQLIDATPNLDWMLLTKRPENIIRMWPVHSGNEFDRNNVWLGCSVESQEYADKRIPELLRCRDLAPVLFLSCEPLVGPVDLTRHWWDGEGDEEWLAANFWVITGGESGPDARPMHPEWFRSLRDQCEAAGVPFHFKQWGEWAPSPYPGDNVVHIRMDGGVQDFPEKTTYSMGRVGKKNAGRLLDCKEHNGMPGPATI